MWMEDFSSVASVAVYAHKIRQASNKATRKKATRKKAGRYIYIVRCDSE